MLLGLSYRRDAAKSKLPVLNLLTGRKSTFSHRRGDSLHRFTWNLAQPRGMCHVGPLGSTKFHANRCPGVGTRPSKWQKFSLFVRGLYTPNYRGLVFYIWHDSLHRLRSHCWETARRLYLMNISFFLWSTINNIIIVSGETILRAENSGKPLGGRGSAPNPARWVSSQRSPKSPSW